MIDDRTFYFVTCEDGLGTDGYFDPFADIAAVCSDKASADAVAVRLTSVLGKAIACVSEWNIVTGGRVADFAASGDMSLEDLLTSMDASKREPAPILKAISVAIDIMQSRYGTPAPSMVWLGRYGETAANEQAEDYV